MARIEEDKEDLMVDATALIHRAEFVRADGDDSRLSWRVATIGFRKDQSLSLYFDQDPFYQFDSTGLLRRALENDFLFRSQGNTLARLHRQRSNRKTALVREDLSRDDLQAFQQRMRQHLEELVVGLSADRLDLRRLVTDSNDLQQRITIALEQVLAHEGEFLSSTIRQRR